MSNLPFQSKQAGYLIKEVVVSGREVNRSDLQASLRRQLIQVEERIAAACRRSGRSRAEVTLVAVTKTVSAEVAGLLPELGVGDLGESRPQELWRKAEALHADPRKSKIRWHLIGHLQRNKIEQTLPLVSLIHSVDSLRLLQALEQAAADRPEPAPVLLEVNMSREANKHGFSPEELAGVMSSLSSLQGVQVRGLMTMAALEDEPQRCRPTFRALRGLRDSLRGNLAVPHTLEHLSMGMSSDFDVAVEEGATLVRVGTALVGGLNEVSA
jgi:pyridoxal phosphate enzyme (YggS family)